MPVDISNMYIGIEFTSDHRYPDYKFVKFSSEKKALDWKKNSGNFAWPGAAREDLPPIEQNWHRRFRNIYKLPLHFRTSKKEIKKIQGTGYYALDYSEALYRYYLNHKLREL